MKNAVEAGMVYRVQDRDGRGPYRPGFSHRWTDDLGPIKLPFADEFGWSLASIPKRFLPHEVGGCGFRTLDQLYDWFTSRERRQLARLGYVIAYMAIDRVLAESDNQVVFARLKPLRADIVILPLTSGPPR